MPSGASLATIPRLLLPEWTLLHPILEQIAFEWITLWCRITDERSAMVTSIYRDRNDTMRIYREAGKQPPAASVHEQLPDRGERMSGVRGIDFSVRRYADSELIDRALIMRAVEDLNGRWRYQPGEAHSCALFHEVSGPHVHLQCRPLAETARR